MGDIIQIRVKDFSKTADTIQTILIFAICLIVPMFLSNLLKNIFPATSVVVQNAQIIVGSIVNTALVISALNLKGWSKILGVVTMPSIATILSGYVLGSASPYMVWMIPAIWVGNFALVYSYKYLFLKKKWNYIITGIIGIITKVAIIYISFNFLKYLNVFPDKLVASLKIAMGSTQVITATIGVIIAYLIYVIELPKEERKNEYCN